MIDIHGHLLPGLDDGSRDLDESLAIAEAMLGKGYRVVTCTPHVWPNLTRHRPGFIIERTASLQAQLDKRGLPLRLFPGAELNLDLDLYALDELEIPTHRMVRKFALFDFWDDELPPHFWLWIARVKSIGATPVVAHPERVAALQTRPDLLDAFRDAGLLLQCNLQSLGGSLGSTAKECAEEWLAEGRYFCVGTDLHRLDTLEKRFDGLTRLKSLVNEKTFDRLTRLGPATLLHIHPDTLEPLPE